MKESQFTKVLLMIIIVLLSLNLIVLLLSSPAPSYAAKSIQYKAISLSNLQNEYEIEKLLNEYGKEGWELITGIIAGAFGQTIVIFKR